MRSDIKIFVVNRHISKSESEHRGLEEHIKALRAYGYSVDQDSIPFRDMSHYDIIVAHPAWGHVGLLIDFHKKRPEIPMIIDSGVSKVKKEKEFGGYIIDADGIYYPWGASMQDFLKLIKKFTGDRYMRDLVKV